MILGTFRDKRGGLDRHIDTDSENEADGSGASQEKLVGWLEGFTKRKTDFEFALSIHTARNVDSVKNTVEALDAK